jgi:hypothetical protein
VIRCRRSDRWRNSTAMLVMRKIFIVPIWPGRATPPIWDSLPGRFAQRLWTRATSPKRAATGASANMPNGLPTRRRGRRSSVPANLAELFFNALTLSGEIDSRKQEHVPERKLEFEIERLSPRYRGSLVESRLRINA